VSTPSRIAIRTPPRLVQPVRGLVRVPGQVPGLELELGLEPGPVLGQVLGLGQEPELGLGLELHRQVTHLSIPTPYPA
jgi:hypothetical protein